MTSFAWWSVRHRWWVIGGWVASVLLLAGLSLAAGDQDQIVVHVTDGTVTDPAVTRQLDAMFTRVARLPHVVSVASPYDSHGQAISRDARTAFADVTFDEQANDLPVGTATTVIAVAQAARTPTLQVALLGQAIESSESSGPSQATAVGLGVAVLVLLVLFGSVAAMLMPIITVLVAVGAGISVNSLITHVRGASVGPSALW